MLTGFYFSTRDIRNVAEVASFWAIGFTFIAAASRLGSLLDAVGFSEMARHHAALMVFAAGLGSHLANYFWSALAKLWLDGGLLSWLLDNRLYDSVPAALRKGTLPLAAFPPAVAGADLVAGGGEALQPFDLGLGPSSRGSGGRPRLHATGIRHPARAAPWPSRRHRALRAGASPANAGAGR